jgi:hypothetical protein
LNNLRSAPTDGAPQTVTALIADNKSEAAKIADRSEKVANHDACPCVPVEGQLARALKYDDVIDAENTNT